MPTQRVRMIDVAEAAGVSRTTASFVLNGRDNGIPTQTRQRVLRTAHEMGYRRHSIALALATGRTYRLGIVPNEPDSFQRNDLYLSQILAGIMSGSFRNHYNILLHQTDHADWNRLYAETLSGATDGTILIGRYADDPLTPALLEAGVPVVCVSYHIEHPRCFSVDCDNEMGGYLALHHLLSRGHRRIAFFYPGNSVSWGQERRQGALRALAEAGLPATALHVYEWPETHQPSQEWVQSALEFLQNARPHPTALVCCEELRVRSVVESLPALGVRVPDDLAVVSFNSTDHSARTRPPLTSIWQPLEEIGEAAVEMLVHLIEGKEIPERHRRFSVRLDARESTGRDLSGQFPSCALVRMEDQRDQVGKEVIP